jgi:hypothetical protein
VKFGRHEGSERREGITEFKNKNLQNNMKGLLGKKDDGNGSEEDG